MPETMSALSAADYFQAKLDYEMTPWGLKTLLEKGSKEHLVLDVRSPEDYAQGHIPGAASLPLAELPAKLSTLPKDKTIVTYCGSLTCALAPKAALQLARAGFKTTMLVGGFATWREKGFPVQK